MLEIRPICENCGKSLSNDSEDALICSFECTFCEDCVTQILQNVCPNCGGGFEKRPTRPSRSLEKNPVSDKRIFRPVDNEKFAVLLTKYKAIPPAKR